MKKYLFIFLTLCNVYYAKGTFNGVGLSSYEGQLGFNFIRQFGMSSDDIINEEEGYFIGIGGNIPWIINENNTYDIDDEFFNDIDKGKQKEFVYIFGGKALKIDKRQTIYLGVGYSYAKTYFKRKDELEVLGNGGIYYIEDEGGEKQSQLGTFGLMIDANKNILRISKYGFIYNLSDSPNLNFTILW